MSDLKQANDVKVTTEAEAKVAEEVTGKTCGGCAHARIFPAQMGQIQCYGGPPQIVGVPVAAPNGQMGMAMQQFRPVLPAKEPACGMWAKKAAIFDIGSFNKREP